MGLVKSLWIESQKRGWDAPEKFACSECVAHQCLKQIVEAEAKSVQCG